MKKFKIPFFAILTLVLFLGLAHASLAVTIIDSNCIGAAEDINACGLSAMIRTLINVTTLIFEVTGGAALAVFVYGGFMWIIAAGNQERVEKGKEAMKAAAIGILIIFSSWMIINFAISALTGSGLENVTIFGNPWYQEQPADSAGATGGNTTQPAPAKPPEAKPPAPAPATAPTPVTPPPGTEDEGELMSGCGGAGEDSCQALCLEYCLQVEHVGGTATLRDGQYYCSCRAGAGI